MVRPRSAKPLRPGSNPGGASINADEQGFRRNEKSNRKVALFSLRHFTAVALFVVALAMTENKNVIARSVPPSILTTSLRGFEKAVAIPLNYRTFFNGIASLALAMT